MKEYKIGFIGYGKMAQAIASCILAGGDSDRIVVSDPYAKSPTMCGIELINNNAKVVKACDIIFLAVKPQQAAEALDGICFKGGKIVVSIMAGITIKKLKELTNYECDVVRVMPNLNAEVARSTSAVAFSDGIYSSQKQYILGLIGDFGAVYEMDESKFDAFTGISGSAPAYVFRFIKNIIECATENGFDFETAKRIVLNVVGGSVEFLLNHSESIAAIEQNILNVCSKGGTTIEGIYALNEGNFDNTTKNAIKGAIKRSKELGKS